MNGTRKNENKCVKNNSECGQSCKLALKSFTILYNIVLNEVFRKTSDEFSRKYKI